eukprot:3895967-Pleurochrysis_carterae.AAC.1
MPLPLECAHSRACAAFAKPVWPLPNGAARLNTFAAPLGKHAQQAHRVCAKEARATWTVTQRSQAGR